MIIFVVLFAIIMVFTVLLAYYGAYLIIMPETLGGSATVFILGSIFVIALFVLLRFFFAGMALWHERRKIAQEIQKKS